MSTTPLRSRTRVRAARAAGFCASLLTGTFFAGLTAVASTAGSAAGGVPSESALPLPIDADTEVRGAADALAPALRLNSEPPRSAGLRNTPIFPMRVEPRCDVLDNFADSRPGGRVHQGTDMLATLGQPVYAVVDGTLGQQVVDGAANSSLSGNSWRLTEAGGTTWFAYLHLAGFAPGLANGSAVVQGQVIGYVGDTGNPGPGNFHLHFEAHPDGGRAVNALGLVPVPAGCTVQGSRRARF